MSSSLPQPSQLRKRRRFLPYLILTLGLAFTFLVSFYFSKLAKAQDQSRFEKSVQEIDERITARLQTSEALLRAGTGLFAASDEVAPQEFDRFVQQIELQSAHGASRTRTELTVDAAPQITEPAQIALQCFDQIGIGNAGAESQARLLIRRFRRNFRLQR